MSEEAERWKEKYLKSLEQQEKLENRWNARLDLLRRGLVRSSLAAEGTDRAVDQCMKEMREVVRKDDMDAALAALLPRLEKAVLDSEQRRETRVGQMGTALNALVAQLQSLPLPREVSRPLKRFAKQLDERVSQARELPLLLAELSGLQGKALTQLENADETSSRPGLLQRLFGGREAANTGTEPMPEAAIGSVLAPVMQPVETHIESTKAPEHVQVVQVASPVPAAAPATAQRIDDPVEDTPEPAAIAVPVPVAVSPTLTVVAPAAPDARAPTEAPVAAEVEVASVVEELLVAPELIEQRPVASSEHPSEAAIDTGALAVESAAESVPQLDQENVEQDVTYDLPATPEPTYSSVAAHIEETLLGLLDDLTLPERHQPQAQSMRERLAKGLNWYELLPLLDDLVVLMLAITDSGQHEFEVYLKQLNERLESFQSSLQAASEGQADSCSVARDMQNELREQVDGLQSSVQDAADLDSLKHVLENRLEGLLGTMDQHQQQRDEREQEVAARLQGLANRVATMEQEAQGFRVHLEEQRQKALVDPLTGLPNRAAWSERLEQEVGLRQKNGNELLLGMLDLDYFKRINDNYGHLAGDKVLKIIATELRKRLRPGDFIARFGGEEFVLLIPHTSMPDGMALMNKLRRAIEACPFHFKGEPVTVTISVGITAFGVGERSEWVLKRADEALYRAKDEGRNRIERG
ncbi:GGDEF domain-containing protein [Pseudomonas sp. UMAB-08]|uniref:GGDEF domain-containing protein n=1 Tax=Pseudomonas sp. UMAB-08 TaxID=1365375 RepID=UPI001C56C618|nr:GGDEF domain-containing protein [Pseudomonas sp. UMAB-08]